MGLGIMVVIYFRQKKEDMRKKSGSSQRSRQNISGQLLGLLTPFIIIGGIYGEIFTATEAAATSVIYALIVSFFIYKEIKISDIPES